MARAVPDRGRLPHAAATTLVALAALLVAAPRAAAQEGERELRDARAWEIEQLRPLFDKAYEAGSDYYKNGWRSEALWCFERATTILPEAGNLARFTGLLRDFDNPVWRRKRWKSPRAGVETGFARRKQQFDQAYVAKLIDVGVRHAKGKGEALAGRSREAFRGALTIAGGPYELAADGALRLGKAGAIPAEHARALVAEELVLINGQRWLRDTMLRSLPETAAVHEARSEAVLVRTVTSLEEATRLRELLEQACPEYERRLGARRTARPLGLFVFADGESYRRWCAASGHDGQAKAAGFANSGEGFAVTFAQPTLDKTAVHEGAHLWHFDVYAAPMPSWYEEGVACFFGHEDSMRVTGGKLATGIAPSAAALAPLLHGGRLAFPLDDLLHGDAAARIAADDGSAPAFYRAAWALYCFLSTTRETTLSRRFEEWESFALGSRGGTREEAVALFDHLFGGERARLEAGFLEWLADPVVR